MATYYIGADVHSNSIEMAVMNRKKNRQSLHDSNQYISSGPGAGFSFR